MARARKSDESFKAYRKRQNDESRWIGQRCATWRVLWNSTERGTYVRAIHGELK